MTDMDRARDLISRIDNELQGAPGSADNRRSMLSDAKVLLAAFAAERPGVGEVLADMAHFADARAEACDSFGTSLGRARASEARLIAREFRHRLSAPPIPATCGGELRPEVLAFAHLMERQLRANDHKPGWKGDSAQSLWRRVNQEAHELGEAVVNREAIDSIEAGKEAADVANFAMMIADVCGALPSPGAEGDDASKGKEQWSTSASTVDARCVAAAVKAVRDSFMTSVSGGTPHPYYVSLAYPTLEAMHEAHDALLALGSAAARAAAQGAGLLREPTKFAPAGCHCKGTCGAPVIMGRQQPCRRPGGVPGKPAPDAALSPTPVAGGGHD